MFNIIHGQEGAILKSAPVNSATDVFVAGEWVQKNSAGKIVKIAGKLDATKGKAYQVWGGTERLDSKARGVLTLCYGNNYYAETDVIAAVTFVVGTALTVEDGKLTNAGATDVVVAFCEQPNVTGVIEFSRA